MEKVILVVSLLFLALRADSSSGDQGKQISTFITVESKSLSQYEKVIAFILKTPDNSPINWKSERLTPIQKISGSEYKLKVNIPADILENIDMLECIGVVKRSWGILTWMWPKDKREIEVSYGGIGLNLIDLQIKSKPQGADVYLIPMRIWNANYSDAQLDGYLEELELYKVNTSVTDTFVKVDETVFKVVLHINGQFKTTVYRPIPQSVEPSQTVFMQL